MRHLRPETGKLLQRPASITARRAECYTELAVDGGVHWCAVGALELPAPGFPAIEFRGVAQPG
jgi:hypothetical protein